MLRPQKLGEQVKQDLDVDYGDGDGGDVHDLGEDKHTQASKAWGTRWTGLP